MNQVQALDPGLAEAAVLTQSVLEGAKPRKRQDPATWAEENRELTSKESTAPGKFSMRLSPHLWAISESLHDPYVERVVGWKPVQAALTTMAMNWIGQRIDQNPTAMFCMLPGEKTLKKNLTQKINPMLGTPVIREKCQVRDDSGKKQKSNDLEVTFPGGVLFFANSNSSTDLRNVFAELFVGDEVDEWEDDLNGQGDPLELMLDRGSTGILRKEFLFSTGTSKETSRIERLYHETDMRKPYVPCPQCDAPQILLMENLIWHPGQYDDVHFVCIDNGCVMEEKNKLSMVRQVEWIPERPEIKHAHGYWWNMFIQVLGTSWANVAKKWDRSEGKPARKTVINNMLTETTEDATIKHDWHTLYKRREKYPVRKVPKGAMILTTGADVQQEPPRIEAYTWAWGPNLERWLVDFRVFKGRVDVYSGEAFQKFAAYLKTFFPHEQGGTTQISLAAIDTRKHQEAVLAWVSQDSTRRMAVHGVGQRNVKPMPVLGEPKRYKVDVEGLPQTRVVSYPVGVSMLKSELYAQLALEIPEDGEFPTGWCHLPESDEIANQEILEQLVGEALIERMDRLNRYIKEWKKLRKRNEALDCANYARAASHYMGLDALTDEEWKALLDGITAATSLSKKPKPPEDTEDDYWGDTGENHW